MKTKRHTQKSAISASPEGGEVRIEQATASYEKWMGSCTAVVSSDLRLKHEQMKESPFLFCGALSTGGPSCGRQSAPTCVARLRCSLWETCMSRVLEPGETQRVASVGQLLEKIPAMTVQAKPVRPQHQATWGRISVHPELVFACFSQFLAISFPSAAGPYLRQSNPRLLVA